MNLRVAGVRHEGSAFVGAEGGHDIAAHGIGREIENVSVSAGGEDDGVGGVGTDFTGDEVADDDAFGLAVDDDEVEHLGAGVHGDSAFRDFLFESLVATDEELLSGLAAGVEGPLHLSSAERAVVEEAAVFAGERNALGDALVNDLGRDFSETVDVAFPGAEVAAFDGIVEEAVNGVAIVLVILGGVDPALGCDGVGAARAVLVAEAIDVVTKFGKGGCGGSTGEAGTDHDDFEFSLVGGVDQLGVHFMGRPFVGQGAIGDFRI